MDIQKGHAYTISRWDIPPPQMRIAVVRTFRMILLAAACLLATSPEPATAQRRGALAPPGEIRPDTSYGAIGEWFALRAPNGELMQYSEFAGRVLFVNFWATWCAPCVEEMPTIVALADAVDDPDVAFLLVSIDEERRDVERFVKKYDLDGLAYLRAWDSGSSTFEGGMVPATFIVDKDGRIIYKHHGAANWNTESIRQLLRSQASG